MGRKTGIGWCDFSFNFWNGCNKISPGCKHCYAEEIDRRFRGGDHWGADAPRQFFDDEHWKEPRRWDRAAEKAGQRRRVFGGSTMDFFEDRPDLVPWRERAWDLIRDTPHLDWLLVTKRPENIPAMLPRGHGRLASGVRLPWSMGAWPNVWIGVTCEDQEHAELRIPLLFAVEPRPVVLFASYEPALGPINWNRLHVEGGRHFSALHYQRDSNFYSSDNKLDWIIVGCESGRKARPYHASWFRQTRDQCIEAETALFVKQATDVTEVTPNGIDRPITLGKNSRVAGKAGRASVLAEPLLDGVAWQQFPCTPYGADGVYERLA